MTILSLIFVLSYLIQIWSFIQMAIDSFKHGENIIGVLHLIALGLCTAIGIFMVAIAPQIVFVSILEAVIFLLFTAVLTFLTGYLGLDAYESHTGKKSAIKTRIDKTVEATGSAFLKTIGIAQLGFGIIKNNVSKRFQKQEIVPA